MRFKRTIFFIGWVLSPLSLWNDPFVNIPLAYIGGNILIRLFPIDFLVAVLVSYWASNGLGTLLMFWSGHAIFTDKVKMKSELLKTILAIILYSTLTIVLHKVGILKPI